MECDSVTAIVPTFNRAKFLPQALDSILGQTRPPIQIIVVDDGSTDDTHKVISSYGDRVESLTKANGGKASALNLALPRARGDLVWIFDDDDVALPDAIERHLATISRHPEVGFSYSSFYWGSSGADGRIVPGPEYAMPDVPTNEVFIRLLEGVFFPLVGCLVRARCYAEIGLFDATMIRSEDYEMQLRLARRYPCAYIGAPTMYVRQHAGLRGAKSDLHSAAERDLKHLAYDRVVIERLMRELHLSDFLPDRRSTRPLMPRDRRRALLQRQCVMMRKGFWAEALRDLREAMTIEGAGEALSEAERRICLASFGEPTVFGNAASVLGLLKDIRQACATPTGVDARTEMARSIYYGLLSRSWDPIMSLRMTVGVMRLTGARGAWSLAMRKCYGRAPNR